MNYREIAKASYFKQCAMCGSQEELQVHHRNGDHEDNSPGNLIYLCRDCHELIHKKRIPGFDHVNKGHSWRGNLEWNRKR